MIRHLSVGDLDSFMNGNIPDDKKNRIKKHLDDCTKCKIQFAVLKQAEDYLEAEGQVSELFTKRVVASLSNKKRKTSSRTKHRTNVLKPVLAFLMVLGFMGLAFYTGTKYDSFKRRTAILPNTAQNTEPTPTDLQKEPIVSQTLTQPASQNPTQPDDKQNSGSSSSVIPVQAGIIEADGTVTLTLYFPNANADSVVPEERLVEVKKGELLEKVIFTELQKGPENTERGSIIPEGTTLISVDTKDGICYLDLSSEFVDNNPGGSAFEAVLINSIVNTLTELPQVKKVQFLIDGEKREVYSHLIFNEPFERNEDFIRTPENTSEAIEVKLRALGNDTLKALRDSDMEKLSSIVHPDKKVRFSPYTYVDVETDLAFTADEIKTILNSEKVYTWGNYDGSGEPIKLTFKDYLSTFVYDKDFLNAKDIGYNRNLTRGNTLNNIYEVYLDAIVIEYHFPGFDPQFEGLDWESLKLVFEEKDGNFYLVGIVHDQWTI